MARRVKGWAEQDVFTRWRRLMCFTQRAGVCKSVKRAANRRDRRAGKKEARRGGD
jgi:hypothetical protein